MKPVPLLLRVAYCIVVLAAAFPVELASSPWIRLSLGGGMGLLPPIAVLPLLLLAVYRVVLVIKSAHTLAAPPAAGTAKVMRVLGIAMLAFGALVSVLNLVVAPLMRHLVSSPTWSGSEYFATGFYLALLGGIGIFGLLLFEFSRLLAFEAAAQRAIA